MFMWRRKESERNKENRIKKDDLFTKLNGKYEHSTNLKPILCSSMIDCFYAFIFIERCFYKGNREIHKLFKPAFKEG